MRKPSSPREPLGKVDLNLRRSPSTASTTATIGHGAHPRPLIAVAPRPLSTDPARPHSALTRGSGVRERRLPTALPLVLPTLVPQWATPSLEAFTIWEAELVSRTPRAPPTTPTIVGERGTPTPTPTASASASPASPASPTLGTPRTPLTSTARTSRRNSVMSPASPLTPLLEGITTPDLSPRDDRAALGLGRSPSHRSIASLSRTPTPSGSHTRGSPYPDARRFSLPLPMAMERLDLEDRQDSEIGQGAPGSRSRSASVSSVASNAGRRRSGTGRNLPRRGLRRL